jgi:UDPglucose 6-dehydrogenase
MVWYPQSKYLLAREIVWIIVAEVAVLGLGYVGIASLVGLAKLGHNVIGVDTNATKISSLRSGQLPIHEPALRNFYGEVLDSGKVELSSSYEDLSGFNGIVIVCVSTPATESGGANLDNLESAIASLTAVISEGSIIAVKSTVPIGTCESLSKKLEPFGIRVASNPEFLAEGRALEDFLEPSRIVVGSESKEVADSVMSLYELIDSPRLVCGLATAESIKYASNAFLAVKLSFVNEIASLSERTGADTSEVLLGMSMDERIGDKFLSPGPGWGGSCFPKDTKEIVFAGQSLGSPLLTVEAAVESNQNQIHSISNAVVSFFGGNLSGLKVAIWGLAFKANTDDTRDSPSIEISRKLAGLGAEVVVYDPMAKNIDMNWITMMDSAVAACDGASALLVLTEWPEFSEVDPVLVKTRLNISPLIFDTRRILNSTKWSSVFDNFRVLGQR